MNAVSGVARQRSAVRIGGASGFWGDTALAVPQLLAGGRLDYLVFDYLAEVTMSILAAQRAKDARTGVANAGGVNPLACRDALRALAAELGIALKIGVVLGDDLVARAAEFREAGVAEMFSGEPFPQRVASINAYLGALPIARALDAGCDVVITGRCVDSAVTLGVLMHEFGWAADAYDRLAQGTLAGHLIECGAQCTGGLFTDWELVPDWENIGFPIVEAEADGGFVITKSPGTGGLVTPATVAEQLLYEIGDPRAYLVPDVSCDFTQVRMLQDGVDRVRVLGATGRAPTANYKVSATFADGYRNTGFLTIAGEAAVRKAQRTGNALLTRMRRMLEERKLPPFTETRIEVLGGEEMFGANGRSGAREVVLKMSAKAASKDSLELFAREFAPAATSMAPGTLGLVGGRPSPTPVVRLFSFLWPKSALAVAIEIDGEHVAVAIPTAGGFDAAALGPALRHAVGALDAASKRVPLIALAHGRVAEHSTDDERAAEWPLLSAWLTPERVAAHFAHRAPARVERFDLPGLNAMNFVLHGVLGGGGMASLHTDNLAKAYAQVLLAMDVPAPY